MKLPAVSLASDRAVLAMSTGAVLAVTGIAAVNSYNHIEALAIAHGQTLTESRLLPLSVDGLVAAASLQLVRRARTSGEVYVLAWLTLALGVLATLAANVAAGWSHGVLGGALSGWPALAFILAAEMSIGAIRKRAKAARKKAPAAAPEPPRGRVADRAPAEPRASADRAPASPRAAAAAIIKGAPGVTGAELGAMLSVPERTARRWRAELAGTGPELEPLAAVNGHA